MENNLAINDVILIEAELAIQWNDEEQTYIQLKLLRDKCPCAFCSGEKDVLGNIYKGPKQDLKEISYMVVKWEKVGHYALRLFWKDGHADGLYTFEMLRKLGEINEN